MLCFGQVHIQILLDTFSSRISQENLIKDQNINFPFSDSFHNLFVRLCWHFVWRKLIIITINAWLPENLALKAYCYISWWWTVLTTTNFTDITRYREPGFACFKTVIIDFCDASGRFGKTGEKSVSLSTSPWAL